MRHSRERRKWFAANFGRSYFKSAPLINPSGLVALAVPCILLLVVVLMAVHPHFAVGAALLPIPAVGDLEVDLRQTKNELLQAWSEYRTAADSSRQELQTKILALQRQVDGIDVRLAERPHGSGAAQKTLVDFLKEEESFGRLFRDRRGCAILNLKGADCRLLERKTTLTETGQGYSTTGVMPLERIAGITPEARQKLFLRALLTARPCQQVLIDFVKVTTPMRVASPQTEASTKAEESVVFTAASEKIVTTAAWIPASKQILDDMQELANFISDSLTYYVDLAEEIGFLSGDGSTDRLHGIIPQAQVFNTALLAMGSAGYTMIDNIAAAVEQLNISKELPPSFCILNPADWWKIRRVKDALGRYLLGNPGAGGLPMLWDLNILATVNMAAGNFLVGSADPAAIEIRDRAEVQIEVSTSHSDFFTRNLVAVRGERRSALILKRPDAFVWGAAFTTSP